jgi:hypothetical protein
LQSLQFAGFLLLLILLLLMGMWTSWLEITQFWILIENWNCTTVDVYGRVLGPFRKVDSSHLLELGSKILTNGNYSCKSPLSS